MQASHGAHLGSTQPLAHLHPWLVKCQPHSQSEWHGIGRNHPQSSALDLLNLKLTATITKSGWFLGQPWSTLRPFRPASRDWWWSQMSPSWECGTTFRWPLLHKNKLLKHVISLCISWQILTQCNSNYYFSWQLHQLSSNWNTTVPTWEFKTMKCKEIGTCSNLTSRNSWKNCNQPYSINKWTITSSIHVRIEKSQVSWRGI